ncbi:uncharacterized protein PHACADRAFT_88781, partial [Phanerochaete carnosa HHB-10118-sp]
FNVLSDLSNRDIVGGLDPLASFDENPSDISITEECDPAECNVPNGSGPIAFNEHYMSVIGSANSQAPISIMPPPYDNAPSPSAYDHTFTASSNGACDDRSRALSPSSDIPPNSPPPNSLTQNFESMRFESPSWSTSRLPPDGHSSPAQRQKKTGSLPQFVIPVALSPATAVRDEPPTINASDDSMQTGPQLHIVPTMPISSGDGVTQSVPMLQQGVCYLLMVFCFALATFPSVSSTLRKWSQA